MGAPRKRERIKVSLRLIKEHVEFFKENDIKINTWIVDKMEDFVKDRKNSLK